jgi:hypothetical protein
VSLAVGPVMRTPDRIRRFVERLLPWYDPEAERKRTATTEAIRQRSLTARLTVEHLSPEAALRVRAAYAAYARQLHRR